MSRRIKILFTTSNFKTAGSGKVIYDLVKGLDKTKFEVEIACGRDGGHFFKTISDLGLPIHVFPTKTSYRPYYSLYSRIRTIASFYRNHDYDLVHSWQWSNDWTEGFAAKLAGIEWIFTKKAMGFKSKHWKIKSFLADFIITINDEMQGYFPYKKNQRLIPLGVDTNYYNPCHFPETKNLKIFNIITVANLVPLKGIETLLEAIVILKDPSINLTIVGDSDNDYGDKMKALSKKLEIDSQVKFLGKCSDVRPYLVKADLYVITTKDKGEGMPMALVEAMSMAIPVFGSDISGINYVLHSFPELLFKVADSQMLSQKICMIKSLSIEERNEIGHNLRAYCIKHFTVERFIKSHEELYQDLLRVSNNYV